MQSYSSNNRIMRTTVFAALALVTASSQASADSVIIVGIKTTSTAVAYSINNQPMTSTQLGEWMKTAIEEFGDEKPILIQPDSQTTFAVVFTLLESLKTSGVKHFEIIAERSGTDLVRSLTSHADQVKRDQYPRLEPPK